MDAQSIDIETKRRTRMDQMKFSGEVQQLRSDMLEAEDRIVEDLDKLKELLTPYRIASYIFFLFGEELLEKIKTVDWPQFEELSQKAKKGIEDHKLASAVLGISASGLLLYGLLKHQRNVRFEHPETKIKVSGGTESKEHPYK